MNGRAENEPEKSESEGVNVGFQKGDLSPLEVTVLPRTKTEVDIPEWASLPHPGGML